MSLLNYPQLPHELTQSHVLAVEDDPRIRRLLGQFLGKCGFRVSQVGDAAQARALLDKLAFDALIIDIGLPGEDGLSLTKSLRPRIEAPILLLTARGLAADRIEGLSLGADDYLPKPFEPAELALRLIGLLRRAKRPPPAAGSVRIGPFAFDATRGLLFADDGAPTSITPAETALLRALLAQAGTAIDHDALARILAVEDPRSVDVVVARLRRKIERDPRAPEFLQTVRGRGYCLWTIPANREPT